MFKVRLQVDSNPKTYVATVLTPPFRQMPEIIVWGSRTFQQMTIKKDQWIYVECFSYTAIEEVKEPEA